MAEYAIAGSYVEFMEWRKADLDARRRVTYLTADRVGHYTEPGVLHRIGSWERSPALQEALRLEAKEAP